MEKLANISSFEQLSNQSGGMSGFTTVNNGVGSVLADLLRPLVSKAGDTLGKTRVDDLLKVGFNKIEDEFNDWAVRQDQYGSRADVLKGLGNHHKILGDANSTIPSLWSAYHGPAISDDDAKRQKRRRIGVGTSLYGLMRGIKDTVDNFQTEVGDMFAFMTRRLQYQVADTKKFLKAIQNPRIMNEFNITDHDLRDAVNIMTNYKDELKTSLIRKIVKPIEDTMDDVISAIDTEKKNRPSFGNVLRGIAGKALDATESYIPPKIAELLRHNLQLRFSTPEDKDADYLDPKDYEQIKTEIGHILRGYEPPSPLGVASSSKLPPDEWAEVQFFNNPRRLNSNSGSGGSQNGSGGSGSGSQNGGGSSQSRPFAPTSYGSGTQPGRDKQPFAIGSLKR